MTHAEEAQAHFDTLAGFYPVLRDTAGQAEYDATLRALPELIAANPFHPLARLVLARVQELEHTGRVISAKIPAFDIPARQ